MRIMRRRSRAFVAMVISIANGFPGTDLAQAASGGPEQAFHPMSHQSGIDIAAIAPDNVRSGYKQYNRQAIRAAINGNDVFAPILTKMQDQIAQLVALSDDELRALIPPALTIRALMVNTKGCPLHGGGTSVYQPFGTQADIDHPLGVKCPIGGEIYPNETFPDDGLGWTDDRPGSDTEGEKFYFTGWFNHWFLQQLPGKIETMARLWFVLDDERYARTALVLLERFMEVYPHMDGADLTYDGTDWGVYVKMLPTMWEGPALTNLVDSVELLLPLLDDDFLELFHTSVFRSAFEAYRQQPAPSNWGNVWNAPFARFVMITGDQEILNYMLYEHPVAVVPTLDNQFFRDGFPYEAAFGYGAHYLYAAQKIADTFGLHGQWIWDHPSLKRSFGTFADAIILDKYTHFYGDTGSINNKGLTLSPRLLEKAFEHDESPQIARYLEQAYALHGSGESASIEDEFGHHTSPPVDQVRRIAAHAKLQKSTLAPVKGMAIMRTGTEDDRAALYFDYGYAHAAHSHADRLNINLFALGREFLPEMGYPEYMDSIQPTPGGWTTHTASHVTVEVDEKRQLEGVFGDLHGFVHGDHIKYVDASCEDAYIHSDVDLYRRSLALIDIPGGAYAVDIFRVRGGGQHDYLFHGPAVDILLDGISVTEPGVGTLAGRDVAFGSKPDSVLPYHVDNKGYQYLFDVRQGDPDGPYRASWKMDDDVTFSADFLPARGERFYQTTGYPRPSSKSLPPMPFLVRRTKPENDAAVSLFASVLSYTKDAPLVVRAQRLALTAGSDKEACAILIEHQYGEDVVLSSLSSSGYAKTADGRYELHGQFAAISRRDGQPPSLLLVGATSFSAGDESIHLDKASVSANILKVYDDRLVLDNPLPQWVVGEMLLATRGQVESSYRIEKVAGDTVYVTPGTWIGKGRADRYEPATATIFDNRDVFPLGEKRNRLADISGMTYPGGNRNYYAGSWLIAEDGSSHYRLKSGGYPGFVLDSEQDLSKISQDFTAQTPFLLYDLGPGDTVRVLRWKQE